MALRRPAGHRRSFNPNVPLFRKVLESPSDYHGVDQRTACSVSRAPGVSLCGLCIQPPSGGVGGGYSNAFILLARVLGEALI